MNKRTILVLVNNYRTEQNPYANAFVHSRMKAYLQYGVNAVVFVLNDSDECIEYDIDGVHVITGNQQFFLEMVERNGIKDICVHFINEHMIKAFNACMDSLNLTIVVHGDEALHWYERIFPGVTKSIRLICATAHGAIIKTKRISIIKTFLATTKHRIQFVAVSKWMKETAERTWNCRDKYEWNIIPNPIDTTRFNFVEKEEQDRYKLLSIRPFSDGKYANDITASLMKEIYNDDYFRDVKLTWIGTGRLYKQTIKSVKDQDNIIFINHMLQQEEIPKYHKDAGVFICPTRQDAQGVSMCEAMASGLVPITLYNTAIPEFLPNDKRLICHDENDMKRLLKYLIDNPQEYLELSKLCSDYIMDVCSFKNTTLREINLFIK